MGTDEGDEADMALCDRVSAEWLKDAIARNQTVPLMYPDKAAPSGGADWYEWEEEANPPAKCESIPAHVRFPLMYLEMMPEAIEINPPSPEEQAQLDRIGAMIRAQQARNDHARLEGQAAVRQQIEQIRATAEAAQAKAHAIEKAAAPLMRALDAPSMMDVGLPTRGNRCR